MIIGITTWGAFLLQKQKTACSKAARLWVWWPAASRITASGGKQCSHCGSGLVRLGLPPFLPSPPRSSSQWGFLTFCRSQVYMTGLRDYTFFLLLRNPERNEKLERAGVQRHKRAPHCQGISSSCDRLPDILRTSYLVCTLGMRQLGLLC